MGVNAEDRIASPDCSDSTIITFIKLYVPIFPWKSVASGDWNEGTRVIILKDRGEHKINPWW